MSSSYTLTTPQQRILDAIKESPKPIASGDIRVASPSYTDVVIRKFREELHLIYIAAWRKAPNGNNGFCPLYRFGNQPDAPKPVAGREELKRRKSIRVKRKKAKDRAARKAPAEAPLGPPTLPKHTPRYGFWRI